MVVHPAPTSPKQQLRSKPDQNLPADWSTTPMVQPPRTPWGRIGFLMLAISLIGAAAVLAGWGILIQRYPHTWLAEWWPTATTVVREERQSNSEIPNAVQRAAEQLYALATQGGPDGVYTSADVLTTVVPLSGNGWSLAWDAAVPTETELVLLPALGRPVTATGRVGDPSTPFVYLRSDALIGSPATFLSLEANPIGLAVWVVTPQVHRIEFISRQVIGWGGSDYSSSEQLERWLKLDAAVTSPVGSAVIDRQGRLVGMLGPEQAVWPTASVDPILKSLLQLGQVERPLLGVRALDQATAVVTADPSARGWVISADREQDGIVTSSPASVAGLQVGDVIVSLNNRAPVNDLFSDLANYRPGQRLTVIYQRAGVTKQTSLELGTLRP